MSQSFSVILLAGGLGTRMKSPMPKQFLKLKGKPIALYTFELFTKISNIKEIIVVSSPEYRTLFSTTSLPLKFAMPGERRQDSVANGFQMISPKSTRVLIHDAARPLLKLLDLENLLQASQEHLACALAVPVKCTIKECNSDNIVVRTPTRATLFEMQTPQIIETSLLYEGLKAARQNNHTVTDDVSLVELISHPVKLVIGSYDNIKITTVDDLSVAESLLS